MTFPIQNVNVNQNPKYCDSTPPSDPSSPGTMVGRTVSRKEKPFDDEKKNHTDTTDLKVIEVIPWTFTAIASAMILESLCLGIRNLSVCNWFGFPLHDRYIPGIFGTLKIRYVFLAGVAISIVVTRKINKSSKPQP